MLALSLVVKVGRPAGEALSACWDLLVRDVLVTTDLSPRFDVYCSDTVL